MDVTIVQRPKQLMNPFDPDDFSQMGTSFIGVTSILLYFYKEIYSL